MNNNRGAMVLDIICRSLQLTLCALVFSCAQVVTPNGGKKDVTPPRALNYTPDSAAINFNSRSVLIAFDEYIELNDPASQLVISPPMGKPPEIKVKGKELIINLKDSLKKNTTYTLSFGSAVRDITENNPLENFQYVFSTGTFIDSLSVSGKVRNAFDGGAEKGILVMLYRDLSDSSPYKRVPDYFAKTRDDGSYKINNIAKGIYKAFALKDANANYKYDTPEESIAFAIENITLEKNTTLDMKMFKEPLRKQFLKTTRTIGFGHLLFVFNKPVEKLQLRPLNFSSKKNWKIEEWNETRDSLNYWLIDVGVDTLKLEVSDNDKVIDTAVVKLITREQAEKSSRGRKLSLAVAANVSKDQPFDLNKELRLEFSHPLLSVTTGGIHLRQGKKEWELRTRINENPRVFYYDHNQLTPDTLYTLFIEPVITDIFGLMNDTVKIDFKTPPEKFYGTLKLKLSIAGASAPFIVQLLDEAGRLIKSPSVTVGAVTTYGMLHPGKYRVRIIYDDNSNGKWDTGDYLLHQQAEKVIYYPGTIAIRSNWDMEQEWKE